MKLSAFSFRIFSKIKLPAFLKEKKHKKKFLESRAQGQLPKGAQYASFDRRLIAATIDIFILIVVSAPLTRFLEILLFGGSNSAEVIANVLESQDRTLETREFIAILKERGIFYKLLMLQLASLVLLWLYSTLSTSYFKATIGKYIMKLQVVDEGCQNISLIRSNCRFFGYIPSIVFIFLGFFWIYFNDKRKGWHDYLARTVVLYYPSIQKKKDDKKPL